MKRKNLFLLLIFSSTLLLKAQDTILLFNPIKANIETFTLLSNDLMFPSDEAENYHFKGIYHSKGRNNYEEAKEFIDNTPGLGKRFSLYCVASPLDVTNIFQGNAFTSEMEKLFTNSIGAIFLGGPDLPPVTYGASMNLLTNVTDPARHYLELSALFHLLGSSKNAGYNALLRKDPNYVILGICLGMQTINVATGGSMVQDIPTEIYKISTREDILRESSKQHRNYNYDDPTDDIYLTGYHFHPIALERSSRFSEKTHQGALKPEVLSAHHQCIKDLGMGLYPVAYSLDGKIIEAIQHTDYPAVTGVQFHPEKRELYTGKTDSYVRADSVINFKKHIDKVGSDVFHEKFWKMIGELFEANRD